ncbi:hypothetical protein ABEB36_006352 [Hypothenemus hampei]|uniref:Rho-GAP domain-containing protein n=1 Tax=Hypothenemus hampei TaxID=57062 RepID=A0ABD1EQY9_HYPHA
MCTVGFDFGLPLEDIFPSNDIHPRLKFLFDQALRWYHTDSRDIHLIMAERCSLSQLLELKERLVHSKDYYCMQYNTGAYFWMLRHFLGLLPLPLLPSYTNNVIFNWRALAKKLNNKTLCPTDIQSTLLKLPEKNLLLLYVLIQFLRKTSMRNSQSLNKSTLKYLIIYFSKVLFQRPYQPENIPKQNFFCPLLSYIIIKWKNVMPHYLSPKYSVADTFTETTLPIFSFIYKVDASCQTQMELELNGSENDTFYQTANDIVFPSISEEGEDWLTIIEETMKTISKVEESYIYDDYDTFIQEEFNQPTCINGFPIETQSGCHCSTPVIKIEPESSYVKFPDVFDLAEECKTAKVGCKLFCNDSPQSWPPDGSKERLQNISIAWRSSVNCISNAVRFSKRFLRSVTPSTANLRKFQKFIKHDKVKYRQTT